MKLLFLIGSLRPGGAEGQLVLLMKALKARGHQVSLMLLHCEGHHLAAVREAGIPIFDVGLPRFRPAWNPIPWIRLPYVWWRSVRWIARQQPDVLHAQLFWAHLWAWIVLWALPKVPLVTARLTNFTDKAAGGWMLAAENAINRRAAAVVANSQAVADSTRDAEKIPEGKLHIIHNGLDLAPIDRAAVIDLRAAFPALAACTSIGIYVANLMPYKGHRDLIAAWALLARTNPGAGILCVGADGGERPALDAMIADQALQNRIVFAGPRGDVPGLLKGADFAVHCSHDEGFSNAVLEYLASGLPLVATAVGGNPEACEHGRFAHLVPARNPPALAAAIGDLIAAGGQRNPARESACAIRERYTVERYFTLHEELYRGTHHT